MQQIRFIYVNFLVLPTTYDCIAVSGSSQLSQSICSHNRVNNKRKVQAEKLALCKIFIEKLKSAYATIWEDI